MQLYQDPVRDTARIKLPQKFSATRFGNGLASQFWQMEGALRFAFKILYMQLIANGKIGSICQDVKL